MAHQIHEARLTNERRSDLLVLDTRRADVTVEPMADYGHLWDGGSSLSGIKSIMSQAGCAHAIALIEQAHMLDWGGVRAPYILFMQIEVTGISCRYDSDRPGNYKAEIEIAPTFSVPGVSLTHPKVAEVLVKLRGAKSSIRTSVMYMMQELIATGTVFYHGMKIYAMFMLVKNEEGKYQVRTDTFIPDPRMEIDERRVLNRRSNWRGLLGADFFRQMWHMVQSAPVEQGNLYRRDRNTGLYPIPMHFTPWPLQMQEKVYSIVDSHLCGAMRSAANVIERDPGIFAQVYEVIPFGTRAGDVPTSMVPAFRIRDAVRQMERNRGRKDRTRMSS